MNIGFTGTQKGMSTRQIAELDTLIEHLCAEDVLDEEITFFHHGDCVGADAEAHFLALRYGCIVIVHPPSINVKRAWCKGAELRVPHPYLERNHNIVDECDILIAAPKSNVEELRSGTWATYRYAMKLEKTVILLER